ncbi:hypothetical protein DLH72_04235 [Candidatus Gracilibacteria bacterium]|nr:MAG: hypothetical protein DLH72_04235 [Candidatus Gracilibacteria bacterium]
MINIEKKFTPVRAIGSHCGTGAVMNILNYFWGTTFGVKDTFDVETLIQLGYFDWNRRPSESEIGYFLCQMNFKVKEFVKAEKGDRKLFLKDPKAHQEKYGYTYYPLVDIDEHIKKMKLLNNHKNYSLIEGIDVDIRKIIEEKSSSKSLFILGFNYNKLYGTDFPHGGHIVVSPGFDKKSGKIILAETSPNGELVYKDFEEVLDAMEGYEFVMVISLSF